MFRRESCLSLLGRLLLPAFVVICNPVWGFESAQSSGFEAYKRGEYEAAWQQLEPLAARGNAQAQRVVGIMYLLGQGLEKDLPQAALWLKGAAMRGDSQAQELLSYMYNEGLGVPQDPVLAYVWLKLAATSDTTSEKMGGMQAAIARLMGGMDNAQRSRARQMSRQYYDRYAKPFR
jgi:TPR repeat protein